MIAPTGFVTGPSAPGNSSSAGDAAETVEHLPMGGPVVTVDVVVFRAVDRRLDVLTIERRRDPFAGRAALPGAYVSAGETLHEASLRCLRTKAGVEVGAKLDPPRQFHAADSVARDPRGHAISILHLTLADPSLAVGGGESPRWQPADDAILDGLAFDHAEVVRRARRVVESLMWTDAQAFARLAGHAPLTTPRLRAIAEAVHGSPLDHANFTRRLIHSRLFEATEAHPGAGAGPTPRQRGRGRPATVWRIA